MSEENSDNFEFRWKTFDFEYKFDGKYSSRYSTITPLLANLSNMKSSVDFFHAQSSLKKKNYETENYLENGISGFGNQLWECEILS